MDDETTIRLSSQNFSQSDGTEAFRELFGKAVLRIDIDPLAGAPLDITMRLRALPDLGIGIGATSAAFCRHRPANAESDDLVFTIMQQASATVRQYGREATFADGDAVLTAHGDPATCLIPAASRIVNFRFRRDRLAASLQAGDDSICRPVPGGNPALRLLLGYCKALEDERALTSLELRHAVADHFYDLAAVALGATRDAAETARGRGIRAARLQAIKADICANLANPGLSAHLLARRHGISAAYVRKLFDRDGTNLTDFVLQQRLARVRRLLTDPGFAQRTIATLAFECGFGDLSYFNQAFRRRYAATPSDLRAAALEDILRTVRLPSV